MSLWFSSPEFAELRNNTWLSAYTFRRTLEELEASPAFNDLWDPHRVRLLGAQVLRDALFSTSDTT